MTYADYRIAQIKEEYGIDRLVERYGDYVALQGKFNANVFIYQIEFNDEHNAWTETVIENIAPGCCVYNIADDFKTPYADQEVLRLCKAGFFKPGMILKLSHSAKGYWNGQKIAPMPSIYSAQWLPVWQALEERGVVVFTSSGNTSGAGMWQGGIRSWFNRLLGRRGTLPRNVYDVGPLEKDFSWWGWYRTKLVVSDAVPCGAEDYFAGILPSDNSSIPTALVAALFAVAQSCYLYETGQSQVPSDWIDVVCRGMENLKLHKINGQAIGWHFNAWDWLNGAVDGPLKRRRL